MDAAVIRNIAMSALLQVSADSDAPASARSQAATALLTIIGDLGTRSTPLKDKELGDITQLSEADMHAELLAMDVDTPKPGKKRNRS